MIVLALNRRPPSNSPGANGIIDDPFIRITRIADIGIVIDACINGVVSVGEDKVPSIIHVIDIVTRVACMKSLRRAAIDRVVAGLPKILSSPPEPLMLFVPAPAGQRVVEAASGSGFGRSIL
jgi:hypothetical protein